VNYQDVIQSLKDLIHRVELIPRREVLVEWLIVFLVVYFFLRFLRGTRGARGLKGMTFILIIITILVKLFTGEKPTGERPYERLSFLYANFLWFAALAMMIVFQPELRRLLVRLGEARLFRGGRARTARVIDEVVQAVEYLSQNKLGAIIALERDIGLKGIVDTGVPLDAEVSHELLCTIFWPGSALHDMGVVIHDGRLVAAGAQFPLAEEMKLSTELGSRHRAAIGLSQEADALVIVVSEETGTISVAERGRLVRHLTPADLRDRLKSALGRRRLLGGEPRHHHPTKAPQSSTPSNAS
jgi:diadenylate cyclase